MYILKLFLLSFMLASPAIIPQDRILPQKDEAIPVNGFYDSSHHWYDINEEVRAISPLPGQKRYGRTEIREIADNILLYQKI